ncbi:thiol-disulfide oxidoreductase DCC family protein [Natrinema caseinilyticum]|uniref:thiol-disulfide oxidoreductase DCC family protein n=1 Tax=Natrinema caseinilyticum TaxID=2961570 RepID=UPI0020C3DC49|nr:thiol-disulfide oxidoreductase DCC family protein [Natrinema caseinilyticum]
MSEATADDDPVILFDGVCNLCNGFVQFILPRDTDGTFRFASLQSDVGKELLAEHGLPTDELESVVLIEGDDSYVKSSAVIRIARRLGGIYTLFGPFRFVPKAIRDRAYDFVAAHRYRWFGKKDQCAMPPRDVDVGARFLE